MAKTLVDLQGSITGIEAAAQELLIRIPPPTAEHDFQPEVDRIDAVKATLDGIFPPPPLPEP